jgi:hypothetical protein
MQSVYGLTDPWDELIHYIGRAKDVFKRYAQHLNRPHKNEMKNEWMMSVKERGRVPGLLILEQDIEDGIAPEREKHWIDYYTAQGAPLTNIMHNPDRGEMIPTMEMKDTYTLQELFEYLPISLSQLARQSGINEVTLARTRDGERTRRDTVNKLLLAMSRIYGRDLTIRNVTGINVMVNKRLVKKEEKQKQAA